MSNKRNFSRVVFAGTAALAANDQLITAQVVDISMRGLLVDGIEVKLDRGSEWDARIELEGGATVAMRVAAAHQNGHRVGFRCQRINMDEFCQLKRLVELNLGDPDLLERELENLG